MSKSSIADVASSRSPAGKLSKKSKSAAKGLAGEGAVESSTNSAITSHSSTSGKEERSSTRPAKLRLVTTAGPVGGGLQLEGIVLLFAVFRQSDEALMIGTYLHTSQWSSSLARPPPLCTQKKKSASTYPHIWISIFGVACYQKGSTAVVLQKPFYTRGESPITAHTITSLLPAGLAGGSPTSM